MKRQILDAIQTARSAKSPVALITVLDSGYQEMVRADDSSAVGGIGDEVVEAARRALRDDRCTTIETPKGVAFVHVFNPPLRMIIIGAVHIGQVLAPMAALAGYEVTIVDPRRAFATSERFPDTVLLTQWPDEALKDLALDSRTAVLTVTHDPKLDDAALGVALRSEVFYIGSLGSKKTHAARIERLSEAGFGESELARIRAPVGLAIGSKSPAEIAISIMAEVTQVLRKGAAA